MLWLQCLPGPSPFSNLIFPTAVSYRWQPLCRAIVRPPGQATVSSSNAGMSNKRVRLNMSRWQRQQLLSALQTKGYTYVWIDALSIPAALQPDPNSALGRMSTTLLTRMMSVYASAACTLVLRSMEVAPLRYHKRAWTMQEYCCSQRLLVVNEGEPAGELMSTVLEPGQRLDATHGLPLIPATYTEIEEYNGRRSAVSAAMMSAVPMWVLQKSEICSSWRSAIAEGVMAYNTARRRVTCMVPADIVRALLPMFLNTPVQDGAELAKLVCLAHSAVEADDELASAMRDAAALLGLDCVRDSDKSEELEEGTAV